MKDILKFVLVIAAIFGGIYILGLLSEKEPECQVCGKRGNLVECPVCCAEVCESCADDDHYLESLYDNGVMLEYLENRDYLVFEDWDEVLNRIIDTDPDAVIDRLEDYGYIVICDGKED